MLNVQKTNLIGISELDDYYDFRGLPVIVYHYSGDSLPVIH